MAACAPCPAPLTPCDYLRYLVEARHTYANAAHYASPAIPAEQVRTNMRHLENECRKALNMPLLS